MTEFGRGIDPFEVDLLESLARCVGVERFAESDDSLLDTGDGALEQDEVVLDLTIVDESTQTKWLLACLMSGQEKVNIRCDLLADNIELGSSVLLVSALTDTVDLVVDRGTMMVTILTSTSDSPLDVGRMPSTDTGDLSETLVCLSRQLLGSPSAGDTLETMTLGHSNGINNFVLFEDGIDLNGLLE